jgi:hypothetical protein
MSTPLPTSFKGKTRPGGAAQWYSTGVPVPPLGGLGRKRRERKRERIAPIFGRCIRQRGQRLMPIKPGKGGACSVFFHDIFPCGFWTKKSFLSFQEP